jgi:hypothetical protein
MEEETRQRVGTILGIEFENKSSWLVVRLEEIEIVRVETQLINKRCKIHKTAICCSGTRN